MNVYQKVFNIKYDGDAIKLPLNPTLLLVFISPTFENPEVLVTKMKSQFPDAVIAGCSTAGEIHDVFVSDHSAVITAIEFNKTTVVSNEVFIDDMTKSHEVAVELANKFEKDRLKHLFVFSDGIKVNGAKIVEGLTSVFDKLSITGGLAGGGYDFESTFVISDTGVGPHKIVAIGLYSDDLKVGFGSKGGWDSFGIERLVTKSTDNILYELDGRPALEVYKSFLGEASKDLPASGLRFPLNLRHKESEEPVVRTILAVSEEDQSLTFAGSIPTNSYVRMMKANIDRLIDGAEDSAKITKQILPTNPQLSILISCVGRRLVLKQLVEEEIEAVRNVVGPSSAITGFYSYGEIAPFGEFSPCQLHNQTMTITTLSE